jgi:hypothetical protein
VSFFIVDPFGHHTRKGGTQSKIEKTEIANYNPNDGQHTESGQTDLVNKYWYRHKGDKRRRSAADQVPDRISCKQTASRKLGNFLHKDQC